MNIRFLMQFLLKKLFRLKYDKMTIIIINVRLYSAGLTFPSDSEIATDDPQQSHWRFQLIYVEVFATPIAKYRANETQ